MAGRTERGRGARNGSAGQALVEFALVASLMVLLLGSVAQFGMIFERQIGINNAVRDAARRGAALATPDGGTAAANAAFTLTELQTLLANSQAYDPGRASGLRVCVDSPPPPYDTDPSGNPVDEVTVSASYAHPLFLPLINVILDGIDGSNDNALLLSTSATFYVEAAADDEPNVALGSGTCVTP